VIQTDSITSNTACTPSATCFNSAPLVPGTTNKLIFTNTFTVAGTYTYRCARHGVMTGTITVVGGSGAGALTASLSVMFAAIVAALALRQ